MADITGPLALAGMGSFHAGGRSIRIEGQPEARIAVTSATSISYDPNGLFLIEQAYVQWFKPANPSTEIPVLFVHGGGLTGQSWETTPDGRPGWVELFLRAGVPVHVIDNVERGRAGWCVLPGIWEGAPVGRSLEWAWELFRFGRRSDFADRAAFPGQRFPVAMLENFAKAFVPRWVSTTAAQIAACAEAVRRIGRCDLIVHSQGADVGFGAASCCPDLVRSVVAIEPSGYAPMAKHQRLLTIAGDYPDATPSWVDWFARMRAFTAAHPGPSAYWDMAARGRPGHSHMLMMDHGHDLLAADIIDWLAAD